MRFDETHREEQGFRGTSFGGLQPPDRFLGDKTIGVGVVGGVGNLNGRSVRHRGAVACIAWLAFGRRGSGLVGHAGLLDCESGLGDIRRGFRDEMRDAPGGGIFVVAMAPVHDLAEAFGPPAVPLKILGNRDRVRRGDAEVCREIIDPDGGGAKAGHQCIAGNGADGLITVRTIKARAAGGEPIDVRSLDRAIAVGAEQRLQIVHANQEHIGPLVVSRTWICG